MHFTEKLFVYNGVNSKKYGLRIAHLDTNPIENVAGKPEYQKVFYNSKLSNVIVGQNWNDSPISTEIEFISDRVFSRKEVREIEKWLFNKPKFCKLYIDKQEDEDIEKIKDNAYGELTQSYIECVFYEASVIEDGVGVRGFKATMELSSPFAFQDIKYNLLTMSPIKDYFITSTVGSNIKGYRYNGNTITSINKVIRLDNDIDEPIYPIIEFELSGIGSKSSDDIYVSIVNNNDLCKTTKYSFTTDSSFYTDNTIKSVATTSNSQMAIKKISSEISSDSSLGEKSLILDGNSGMFYSTEDTENSSTTTITSYLQNLTNSEFLKLADGDNELTIFIPTGIFSTLNIIFRQVRFIR